MAATSATRWSGPAPGEGAEVYGRPSRWLVWPSQLGQPLPVVIRPPPAAQQLLRPATAADLVHADGSKRIGSAQLWRGGRLLQHGSIQLVPSASLWQELFRCSPGLDPLPLVGAELEDQLCRSALRGCP